MLHTLYRRRKGVTRIKAVHSLSLLYAPPTLKAYSRIRQPGKTGDRNYITKQAADQPVRKRTVKNYKDQSSFRFATSPSASQKQRNTG